MEPLLDEREEKEEESVPFKRTANSSLRSARLAKLANTINTWEDDVRHHPVGTVSIKTWLLLVSNRGYKS